MTLTQSTTQLTDRFEQALIYAHRLHKDQVRKVSGVPYISHLLSVAALVLEDGGSEDEAIAALLHDAVEDQGGLATREVIRQQFGEAVVAIVDGCTESHTVPKPPWSERKARYLEQLQSGSASVRRIALADKLHNARSLLRDWDIMGDRIWTSFATNPEELLAFYEKLLSLYAQESSWMITEFTKAIAELRQKRSSVAGI